MWHAASDTATLLAGCMVCTARLHISLGCGHVSLLPGVPQGSQFSLKEVEVVTATVDLDEVVSYRGAGGVPWLRRRWSQKLPQPVPLHCLCLTTGTSAFL
jgi:hypothetical protein